MTTILIETGGQVGYGEDGLCGSTGSSFERAASGVVMLRRRRDHLVVEESKALPARGSTIEFPERPTAVVGHSPSGKSRIKEHFTDKELELLETATSNASFHYLGSAKIYSQIGKAFAQAVLQADSDKKE